jgi:hypothetical protein
MIKFIDQCDPCRCQHPRLAHNETGRCECGCPAFRKSQPAVVILNPLAAMVREE